MLLLPAVVLHVAIMTVQLMEHNALKLALCISKLLLLVCSGMFWASVVDHTRRLHAEIHSHILVRIRDAGIMVK